MSLKGNEEIVVPALNMKKPIDFNTVDDQDFQAPGGGFSGSPDDEELKIQNIAPNQRPIADAILPYLGEEGTLLVFAKSWQNREKGIGILTSKLNEILGKDAEHANTAVLQVMTECLKDKVQ